MKLPSSPLDLGLEALDVSMALLTKVPQSGEDAYQLIKEPLGYYTKALGLTTGLEGNAFTTVKDFTIGLCRFIHSIIKAIIQFLFDRINDLAKFIASLFRSKPSPKYNRAEEVVLRILKKFNESKNNRQQSSSKVAPETSSKLSPKELISKLASHRIDWVMPKINSPMLDYLGYISFEDHEVHSYTSQINQWTKKTAQSSLQVLTTVQEDNKDITDKIVDQMLKAVYDPLKFAGVTTELLDLQNNAERNRMRRLGDQKLKFNDFTRSQLLTKDQHLGFSTLYQLSENKLTPDTTWIMTNIKDTRKKETAHVQFKTDVLLDLLKEADPDSPNSRISMISNRLQSTQEWLEIQANELKVIENGLTWVSDPAALEATIRSKTHQSTHTSEAISAEVGERIRELGTLLKSYAHHLKSDLAVVQKIIGDLLVYENFPNLIYQALEHEGTDVYVKEEET